MRASLIRLSLAVAALLLCGASITYSVLLCLTFADTTLMRLLAVFTGFALELVKFSLFPVGVALWRYQRRLAAFCCYSLGAVLVAVSFLASVSFFDEVTEAKAGAALAGSARYQARQAQLEARGERIALLQESAARDLEHGYRARANATLDALGDIERERDQLVAQVEAMPANADKPAVAPALVYSVLAALIELCAVAALVLPGEYLLAARAGIFRTQSYARAEQQPAESTSGADTAANTPTADLAQALQSGAVQPSYRAIAKYLRCRHAKAKKAAQDLVQQGILRPRGNGLQLA